MEPLARMFHFDVHLAHAEYTRTGEAYAPTKRSHMAERFGRDSDASSLDSFDDNDDDESLNLNKLEMEDDVPSIKFRGVYTLDEENMRIAGGETERITGDELEDEEQKKFVINGTLYDGKPSDKGWERWDSERGQLTHIWTRKVIMVTPASSPHVQPIPLLTEATKRAGETDSMDAQNTKRPRV
ncbi:hypothetical protein PQX77_002090 [Marasmius sp. AFHP31]|nr:hypothetical protein PQX77_002090 [Marasmius sp. AFHP31]